MRLDLLGVSILQEADAWKLERKGVLAFIVRSGSVFLIWDKRGRRVGTKDPIGGQIAWSLGLLVFTTTTTIRISQLLNDRVFPIFNNVIVKIKKYCFRQPKEKSQPAKQK